METTAPKKMTLLVWNTPPTELGEGDRVIVRQHRHMGPPDLHVATVTKVLGTTSKWIRVDKFGDFTDRGQTRGHRFANYSLLPFEQALLDSNAQQRREYDERQAMLRRISSTSFERAFDDPELRPLLLSLMEKLEAKKS